MDYTLAKGAKPPRLPPGTFSSYRPRWGETQKRS